MSRGLGAEQRIVIAIVVRDISRHWTRADIQSFAWSSIETGASLQTSSNNADDMNGRGWHDKKDPIETNFTRALSSLVKRGLLERHRLSGGHLTWKVTQAGVDEASTFVPASAINDLAKGAA